MSLSLCPPPLDRGKGRSKEEEDRGSRHHYSLHLIQMIYFATAAVASSSFRLNINRLWFKKNGREGGFEGLIKLSFDWRQWRRVILCFCSHWGQWWEKSNASGKPVKVKRCLSPEYGQESKVQLLALLFSPSSHSERFFWGWDGRLERS